MDEAFMLRVKEHIAAATRSVAARSPSDSANLPALQTLEKFMTSYSPDAEQRCGECRAPLVKGVMRICVACGRLQPSESAATQGPSLAEQRPRTTSHPEYGDVAATNFLGRQLQQPTASGVQIPADDKSPAWISAGVGRESHTGQRGQDGDFVGEASGHTASLGGESLSFKEWKLETNEEHTGILSKTDLAPTEVFATAEKSVSNVAREFSGEGGRFEADDSVGAASGSTVDGRQQVGEVEIGDFFDAVSQSASRLEMVASNSRTEIATSDLDDFFSFPQKSIEQEQGANVGFLVPPPSSNKLSKNVLVADFDGFFDAQAIGQSGGTVTAIDTSNGQKEETDFYDFFQAASSSSVQNGEGTPPTSGSSAGQKLGTDYDFFQAAGTSTGQSVEQTGEPHFKDFFVAPFNVKEDLQGESGVSGASSGGESKSQTSSPVVAITDVDFFQLMPNQPRSATVPFKANNFPEISGRAMETEFDDFFQAVPSSSKVSHGVAFNASVSDATKQSTGHTMELSFDDFFKDPTISAAQKVELIVSSAEDLDRQSKQTDFQYPVTAVSRQPEPSPGQIASLQFDDFFQADLDSAAKSSGHDVQADFEFDDFVQAAPQSEKSVDRKLSTDFGDFFEAAPQSVDESIVKKLEHFPTFPATSHSMDTSPALRVPIDPDDFFQGPLKEADQPHKENGSSFEAAHLSGGKSRSQNVMTEFDNFFQSQPERSEDLKFPNGAAGLHSPSDKSRAAQNGALPSRFAPSFYCE